jgi:hypothetical protein
MRLLDRETHEETLAKRFRLLSQKQRDELTRLLGNPPDLKKVPQSFWDQLERDAENALLIALIASTTSAFLAELDELDYDMEEEEQEEAEEALEEWAADHATEIAAGYRRTTRDRVGRILDRYEAGELVDLDELDDALDWPFGDSRAQAIGVTETTAGSTRGIDEVFGMVPGLRRVWRLGDVEQHCQVCLDLADSEEAYWSQFYPDGPPSPHVHCACWIDLVRIAA